MRLEIEAAALTDRGQRRLLNEDAVFQRTDEDDNDTSVGLYVVCDGVGGHQAGEVASQLAIETVTTELGRIFPAPGTLSDNGHTRPSYHTLRDWLHAAISKANARILSYAQAHPQHAANLGTTITLVLTYDNQAYVANVGDSRVYLWRSGQVTQITHDHSLAAELARMGQLDEDQVWSHPRSNVLSRALGARDEVKADVFERELQAGDRLLLCSDGLWRAFPQMEELGWWLDSIAPVTGVCQELVEEANRRDGSDNISAVIVRVNRPG